MHRNVFNPGTTHHNYLCKKCGNLAPIGVGYAGDLCDMQNIEPCSAYVARCACGWSVGKKYPHDLIDV
jgi:hypothetical protein